MFAGTGIERVVNMNESGEVTGNLVRSGIFDEEEIGRIGGRTNIINTYYNLFSCFIHALDMDAGSHRFLNSNTVNDYLPLIKMETLNTAFLLFKNSNQAWGNDISMNPCVVVNERPGIHMRAKMDLEQINDLLDRLQLLLL